MGATLEFLANLLVRLLRVARYAYLLRVPVVTAVVLFVFPFAALLRHSPLRVLFQNLFLLDGGTRMWPWPTFWSTMAALVLAWSILLTSRIVLLNCGDRFKIPSVMTAADLKGWPFFAIVVLSLPTILGQFTQQSDFRPNQPLCTQCIFAIGAAAVCSYALAYIALWWAVLVAPPKTQGSALTFPCPRFMKNWLTWADEHHVLPKGLRAGIWVREHLSCSLWSGYLAGDGFLWSGHWLALLFSLGTIAIYLFVGWRHGASFGKPSEVTALTFVLLLLLNLNLVLAFFAFFLDRFRVPVLVPLILFAFISGNVRSSDCYFHVVPLETGIAAASPGQVLRARAGKPIVVIATAGGGIQASAWTTQVLAGLQEQYARWRPGQQFSENVTLISSVSGAPPDPCFISTCTTRRFPNTSIPNNWPALLTWHPKPAWMMWPGRSSITIFLGCFFPPGVCQIAVLFWKRLGRIAPISTPPCRNGDRVLQRGGCRRPSSTQPSTRQENPWRSRRPRFQMQTPRQALRHPLGTVASRTCILERTFPWSLPCVLRPRFPL